MAIKLQRKVKKHFVYSLKRVIHVFLSSTIFLFLIRMQFMWTKRARRHHQMSSYIVIWRRKLCMCQVVVSFFESVSNRMQPLSVNIHLRYQNFQISRNWRCIHYALLYDLEPDEISKEFVWWSSVEFMAKESTFCSRLESTLWSYVVDRSFENIICIFRDFNHSSCISKWIFFCWSETYINGWDNLIYMFPFVTKIKLAKTIEKPEENTLNLRFG